MWPDQVLNAGPLTLESDVLQTVLSGTAKRCMYVSPREITMV